jgi:hypothetical protein
MMKKRIIPPIIFSREALEYDEYVEVTKSIRLRNIFDRNWKRFKI